MKVKDCAGCIFAKRCRRTTKYYPAGYHPVGMTFYYMWCDLCHQRCTQVKKSECNKIEREEQKQ